MTRSPLVLALLCAAWLGGCTVSSDFDFDVAPQFGVRGNTSTAADTALVDCALQKGDLQGERDNLAEVGVDSVFYVVTFVNGFPGQSADLVFTIINPATGAHDTLGTVYSLNLRGAVGVRNVMITNPAGLAAFSQLLIAAPHRLQVRVEAKATSAPVDFSMNLQIVGQATSSKGIIDLVL